MQYSKSRLAFAIGPRLLLAILVVAILGGCAAAKHRQQMDDFSDAWAGGDYVMAAYGNDVEAIEPPTEEDLAGMDLLELLHLAEAVRLAGDDELSIAAYDQTEEVFRRFDEENVAARAAGQAGAILVNESVRSYRGNFYEAILVNSYKALSFLATGHGDLARIEFNRADDRTRRAVEFFAEQIEAEREALEEEEDKAAEAQSVAATMEADETREALYAEYGNPSQWAVYPDFINPFVTYLHGLYFMSSNQDSGDIARAIESLERVHGMIDNPVVEQDLALAESLASGEVSRDELPGQVWVIYENGMGPQLEEFRIDIPIFLYTQGRPNRPTYAGIALPQVTSGRPANRRLVAQSTADEGFVELAETDTLAEMERVLYTEFQHKFNGILGRAIASAVLHLFIQAEASDRAGLLGALAATALTAQTTEADLRVWRALPDHWQAARFDRPESGVVSLLGDSNQPMANFELPDWPFTLVYVKQPTRFAQPAIRLIDLQGRQAAINPLDREPLMAGADL